jgi:nicotinate-nucleotide pyrophosphorylase (carboxylating)
MIDLGTILPILEQALREDIGLGDVTTDALLSSDLWLSGRILAKENGVAAGLEVAGAVFGLLDGRVEFASAVVDGDRIAVGQVLAHVKGPGAAILTGERVALNFVQRMSGIATLTRRFVERVQGTRAVILDTRKTAPGLRVLDKLAVKMGGGENHRFGLYDMVLIKDNHIAAAGGITQAIGRARYRAKEGLAIEVEVSCLTELREALAQRPDRIMLDNMSLVDMAEAVGLAGGKVELEASGNVTLGNVADIARTGVDFISVGALTHSVHALDISLEITESWRGAGE